MAVDSRADRRLIRVPVDLDERAFWRLAELAEAHDMTVPKYLAELGTNAATRITAHVDEVSLLWRTGMTDAGIARELGWTNAKVARHRQALGLPAQKKLPTATVAGSTNTETRTA